MTETVVTKGHETSVCEVTHISGNLSVHGGVTFPALKAVHGDLTISPGAIGEAIFSSLEAVTGNIVVTSFSKAVFPALKSVSGCIYIDGGAKFPELENAGSLHLLENCEVEFSKLNSVGDVFCNTLLHPGNAIESLKVISGDLDIAAGDYFSGVVEVKGMLSIGRNITMAQLVNAGRVFIQCASLEAPELRTVGGHVEVIQGGIIANRLSEIGGDFYVQDVESTAFVPALRRVGGSVYIDGENRELPALEEVGGNLRHSNTVSVPSLQTLHGVAGVMANQNYGGIWWCRDGLASVYVGRDGPFNSPAEAIEELTSIGDCDDEWYTALERVLKKLFSEEAEIYK